MKRNLLKKALAGLLSAALLALPVLAAEPQQPAAWAVGQLADSYALGLVDDNYTTYIQSPVTMEQLESMTKVVASKLALLELDQRTADAVGLVVDTTRGGVMNALYQEAAAYDLPGIDDGPEAFLTGLGVVQGDGASLAAERTCTYQEAMVMANRLILAVYDGQDAGSRGLLWKATNGDNTLYLLGTIHLDRASPCSRASRPTRTAPPWPTTSAPRSTSGCRPLRPLWGCPPTGWTPTSPGPWPPPSPPCPCRTAPPAPTPWPSTAM